MRRTDDKTESVILWTHHECSKQKSGEVNNAGWGGMDEGIRGRCRPCMCKMDGVKFASCSFQSFGKQCRIGMKMSPEVGHFRELDIFCTWIESVSTRKSFISWVQYTSREIM